MNDRASVAAAALFVGLFAACQASPPPFPPYRPNTSCEEACAHRRSMACTDAEPTKKGTTCEAVCRDVNASGLARWPTDCLVVTRTCDEQRTCR